MVLAVDELDPDVDHRVAGLDAGAERLLDPLLDGGDVLGRDRAALDLVDEVEALLGRRLDVDHDVAELALAAGLADEVADDLLDPVADRLAVGDLGAADVGVDVELAQEAIDDHLEVQLAHPGISVWPVSSSDSIWKVGSSSASRARPPPSFSWSDFVFGSIATAITGSGNSIVSRIDRRVGGRERVAGGGLLEADAGDDVARVALLDLLAVVRVHHQQAPDPLGPAVGRVQHPAAGG